MDPPPAPGPHATPGASGLQLPTGWLSHEPCSTGLSHDLAWPCPPAGAWFWGCPYLSLVTLLLAGIVGWSLAVRCCQAPQLLPNGTAGPGWVLVWGGIAVGGSRKRSQARPL